MVNESSQLLFENQPHTKSGDEPSSNDACNSMLSDMALHIPIIAADELRVRAPFELRSRPTDAEVPNDESSRLNDGEETASSFDGTGSTSNSDDGAEVHATIEDLPSVLSSLAQLTTEPTEETVCDESTPVTEDALEDEREWWLNGRAAHYYPDDLRLPWHFSFIDDGSIGGMSAPVERRNWRAIADAGVGLVVNTTEIPIYNETGKSGKCSSCGFIEEVCDENIFEELSPEDDVKILFLPVPDGSVPRYSQIQTFLKHAFHTIEVLKKRVVIHCQAGIGRTGTLLAIYLMERYNITAREAISRLRKYRPQSLQFNKSDWQTFPFHLDPDPELYSRNLLQECFVQRYWQLVIRPRQVKNSPTSDTEACEQDQVPDTDRQLCIELPKHSEAVSQKYLDSIFPVPLGNLCSDPEHIPALIQLLEEHLSRALPQEDIIEFDNQHADGGLSSYLPTPLPSKNCEDFICYVCRKISVVGPYIAVNVESDSDVIVVRSQ